MRISELITQLQKTQKKYGDMDILMDSNTPGYDIDEGWFCPVEVLIQKHSITKDDSNALFYDVPEGDYIRINPL